VQLNKRERMYNEDKNLAFDMRTVMIGSPSYDFLVKNDRFSRNNLMMKIETNLKHYYRRRFKEPEQVSVVPAPKYYDMRQDNSATQLNPYVL
jgi:hypothetical protein